MAFYRVEKRLKSDGSPRYKCIVRVKEKGKIIFSESKTFSKNAHAEAWGKKRVNDLDSKGVDAVVNTIPLSELTSKFLNDPFLDINKTKHFFLSKIGRSELGKIKITEMQAFHVVSYAKMRRSQGLKPSSVKAEILYLGWCMRLAKATYGYQVSDDVVKEALEALKDHKIVGRAEKRNRRPTDIEIERIIEKLKEKEARCNSKIPYTDIFEFSILSCMRIGEVCRIKWTDLDNEQKAVWVRDRKDPAKKTGNHMLVPLLGGAWELIQRQPKTDNRIFPFRSESVTSGFHITRDELGIEDLRYHDLRREGASRLFEKGYTIDEVAQVTGHRNINTLWQVYTELFPKRLHDKDLSG